MSSNIRTRTDDEALIYALELRDAGYGFAEIGRMTGRDPSNISKQVRAVMSEMGAV